MEPKDSCLVNCNKFGRQAEYFESFVVPLWQGVYDSLISRARLSPGESVLDTGTGSGEVAMRAGKAVGQKGRVLGIDVQPEMLRIARTKAAERGLANVKFRQMPIEALDLSDDSFDKVVGNYSLCCCTEYGQGLEEVLRVMKPGGRLAYNHGGPKDSPAMAVVSDIFGKYKTRKPSEALRDLRASDEALRKAVERYRDPSTTLSLLRSLGYSDPRADVVRRVLTYKSPRAFVDRLLAFDWSSEAGEIPAAEIGRFAAEAAGALGGSSTNKDFRYEDDMIFFTATKT